MDKRRREFLKKAGLLAALGVSSKMAFDLIAPGALDASQVMPNPKGFHGKHWGLVIDTTQIKSEDQIKPIVEACHKAHNVPTIDSKQEVKWIWPTGYDHAFPFKAGNENVKASLKQTPILVLCNHCENPPCVRVCPTQATFKRESDGVVLMDFHRCIGCRFCMAACPYGARSFNFSDPRKWLPDPVPNQDFPTRAKGVVEKCNFCAERLAVGKVPACVEAAPQVIYFGDLADEKSMVRRLLSARYSIRRKTYLGTRPSVYYLV